MGGKISHYRSPYQIAEGETVKRIADAIECFGKCPTGHPRRAARPPAPRFAVLFSPHPHKLLVLSLSLFPECSPVMAVGPFARSRRVPSFPQPVPHIITPSHPASVVTLLRCAALRSSKKRKTALFGRLLDPFGQASKAANERTSRRTQAGQEGAGRRKGGLRRR